MPKGSQNDAKMEAKINGFSNFFKKNEKYEIMLPLQREHGFTGSGYLKIHEKSIQKTYKIDARKKHTKSMDNYAKIEAKWKPKFIKNLKMVAKNVCQKRCQNLKRFWARWGRVDLV